MSSIEMVIADPDTTVITKTKSREKDLVLALNFSHLVVHGYTPIFEFLSVYSRFFC